ncbi:MAG: patatin-like phospholipase family protein [Proteobacteria bacterium]|nr:patatin-like phospholipase family protein [Pseudomonadota bacterium]MBU1585812.1 patatin-like phospholipase family protein [Pseudomonadota bacterium]MBU2451991.1 patatin-like phospholipase family protein [Pseudomonadota bacterium]MBU2627223.1 patatin-like phospholipase family protein [Pseudomonadota bacterium]
MSAADQHIDLEYFLKKVPLFSSIPDSQISEIASCFHFLEVKKDSIVFRQGDLSDSMYIIRTGAVSIYSEKNQAQSFQAELRRGDFFGEMALLSDLPRNADAKVTLDATLFYLKKEDFETLLSKNKHIGLFLSRLYARRLSSGYENKAIREKSTFYTISATDPDLGLSHFLYSMSYHISTESNKKVLVVEPHLELESIMQKFGLGIIPCPDERLFDLLPEDTYKTGDFKWFHHPAGFRVLQVNTGFNEKLVPVLPLLMESFKYRYDIVVFSLSHHFGNLEQQAVRLCDKNLFLINNTKTALQDVKHKLNRLEEKAGLGLDRVRVGVSHLCGSHGIAREQLKKDLNLSETPQIWVDRSDKALNDQIDTQKRFPIKGARAVAREIAGVRIGLALGAGAARGWSHIGVLKVLEDQGIHIDMIAGTSMGALVGAIFAAHGSVDHLRKNTIDLLLTRAQARKQIFDYTLPFRGLLRGKKAMNLVANAIDHADFMDLLIPTFLVGVDIIKGEEVLFETGDVAKAVRSSLSLPAVFAPFKYRGRWMVDGGLLNPVPVNILEQKGADKVIAVCVENHRSTPEQISKSLGIMGVISRTISIVHGRATSGFAQKSDIVIYPDVQGFAWDDFHKGELLMQRGITACEQVIEEIKTLVQ